jgi:hypothetical protein
LDENAAASLVALSADERAEIAELLPRDAAAGTRYAPAMMSLLNA